MIKQYLDVDQPSLYMPGTLFMGRGTNDEGIHYEGFMRKDGTIHYYDILTEKEIKNYDEEDSNITK